MKSSPATLVYVHVSSCVLPLRFQHREGESVVCVGCWSAAGHLEGGGRGSEGMLGRGGRERESYFLRVKLHEIFPFSNLRFGSYY